MRGAGIAVEHLRYVLLLNSYLISFKIEIMIQTKNFFNIGRSFITVDLIINVCALFRSSNSSVKHISVKIANAEWVRASKF